MIAIVHHLQQIMVTENVMLGELVGCAEIVRGSYGRFNDIGQSSIALPSRC
ncbi:meiotically up-regulated 80 protein [Klebsiella pneumoniae]|uniref:meiotically up-regulated 80 protein n=2 Tax=Klebsiella pneumoniae complex TaxID=3390273 RepID=UPI003B28A5DB